jgi:basic membrane protein A
VKRIANEYPNTQFAIIDDESVALTNVSNLSFALSQGLYLAGAALAAADALAVGRALTATPLPQTNLAPFLTHVNFIPDAVLVCPTFLHEAPALTEADDPGAITTVKTSAIETARRLFFMRKCYWNSPRKARPTENSQRFHSACSS